MVGIDKLEFRGCTSIYPLGSVHTGVSMHGDVATSVSLADFLMQMHLIGRMSCDQNMKSCYIPLTSWLNKING